MSDSAQKKREARNRRHRRVRKKVRGTPARPRLAVFRSNKHIAAQVIDDTSGRTLASASSLEASLRSASGGNVDAAKKVGELLASRATEAGITTVVSLSTTEIPECPRTGVGDAAGRIVDRRTSGPAFLE